MSNAAKNLDILASTLEHFT